MLPVTKLNETVNANERLLHRGRYVKTKFLLEVGEMQYLVHIHYGRVETIEEGPFVMPQWTFALRASNEDWEEFWQPHPKPGYHDILALVKFRRLSIEGDQHPFMSNLLYFKDVLESLR